MCLSLTRKCDDDGFTVETSHILASEANSNTNVIFFGGGADARNGVYYVTKYVVKNPAQLIECVPLLQSARSAALRHPSVAEDVGEDNRQAKFMLAKLLNQITGMQEYSMEQCAAASLGIPSSYTTEIYSFCFVWSGVRALRNILAECDIDDCGGEDDDEDDSTAVANANQGNGSSDGGNEDLGISGVDSGVTNRAEDPLLVASETARALSEVLETEEDLEADFHDVDTGENGGGDTGPAAVGFAGGNVVMGSGIGEPKVNRVFQHTDYYYRGPLLADLNYLEYVALVQRMPMKKTGDFDAQGRPVLGIPSRARVSGAGRPRNFVASFRSSHPLVSSHYQALRSKACTPLMAGVPRPTGGAWKKPASRRTFAQYYATLLIPRFPPDLGPTDADKT